MARGTSTESSLSSMEIASQQQIQTQSSPNCHKIQKTLNVEEQQQDRISALPDCLLVHILSLLPFTRDAIITGTLSNRWKSLWTSTPNLIFFQDYSDNPTPDFASSITKTLTQCHYSKLKKFDILNRYDNQFESQVNDWIRYAMNCHVEELMITISKSNWEARLLLHDQFFVNPSVTQLSINVCIFNPSVAISWKMLRKLDISDTFLDEDLIENILSGSPVLETLELGYCYGYDRLNITKKSVRNLVLSGYDYFVDDDWDAYAAKVIEIIAPHVLSLKIDGLLVLWKILLLNMSSLVEAELNYIKGDGATREDAEEMLKGFIQSLCHAKELKIGYLCSKVLSRLEAKGFPILSNIKIRNVASGFELVDEHDFADSLLSENKDCEEPLVDHDIDEAD